MQTERHCAATAAKVKFLILFRVLYRPVSDKDLKYYGEFIILLVILCGYEIWTLTLRDKHSEGNVG